MTLEQLQQRQSDINTELIHLLQNSSETVRAITGKCVEEEDSKENITNGFIEDIANYQLDSVYLIGKISENLTTLRNYTFNSREVVCDQTVQMVKR
jgi:hypothetical protein